MIASASPTSSPGPVAFLAAAPGETGLFAEMIPGQSFGDLVDQQGGGSEKGPLPLEESAEESLSPTAPAGKEAQPASVASPTAFPEWSWPMLRVNLASPINPLAPAPEVATAPAEEKGETATLQPETETREKAPALSSGPTQCPPAILAAVAAPPAQVAPPSQKTPVALASSLSQAASPSPTAPLSRAKSVPVPSVPSVAVASSAPTTPSALSGPTAPSAPAALSAPAAPSTSASPSAPAAPSTPAARSPIVSAAASAILGAAAEAVSPPDVAKRSPLLPAICPKEPTTPILQDLGQEKAPAAGLPTVELPVASLRAAETPANKLPAVATPPVVEIRDVAPPQGVPPSQAVFTAAPVAFSRYSLLGNPPLMATFLASQPLVTSSARLPMEISTPTVQLPSSSPLISSPNAPTGSATAPSDSATTPIDFATTPFGSATTPSSSSTTPSSSSATPLASANTPISSPNAPIGSSNTQTSVPAAQLPVSSVQPTDSTVSPAPTPDQNQENLSEDQKPAPFISETSQEKPSPKEDRELRPTRQILANGLPAADVSGRKTLPGELPVGPFTVSQPAPSTPGKTASSGIISSALPKSSEPGTPFSASLRPLPSEETDAPSMDPAHPGEEITRPSAATPRNNESLPVHSPSATGSTNSAAHPSESATALRSDAPRLIEKVWEAAAALDASQRGRMDLEIPLQDQESVRVRVELRSGEIHATIQSDSPELREALEKMWPDFSVKTHERGFKLADASFSPLRQDAGGGGAESSGQNSRRDAPSEQSASQQRRNEPSSPGSHVPGRSSRAIPQNTPAAPARSLTLWA